ncbi:DUF4232 domain-containing protein [Arthrobacter sp. I2-34]|uniref:DUF4232 domain-containing protein n=1 Tax=Arthrobacter hankyongi TaxID=2904801 RepID=A0ABS9L8J5_9MICC|nr:DUF4232 domain-containing protein [Arthrobacter hankyongi]MCG2622848.1 DUF4232 domain-containing protein [Arthrobacter hankyongi]
MKRNRWWTAMAAASAGAVLCLTGCGQPQSLVPTGSNAASSPASASAAATASGTPTTAASTPAATASAPATGGAMGTGGDCKAAQLKASIVTQPGGGAAGSVYRNVVLANTGTTACTLRGYPGLSYVDAAGKQVGAPADRNPDAAVTAVTVAPGGSAVAEVQQTNAQNYGTECQPTEVAGVRVYPPNDTASLVAPQSTLGCANEKIVLMTVGTFQAP